MQTVHSLTTIAQKALGLVVPSFGGLLDHFKPGTQHSLAICILDDAGLIHKDHFFCGNPKYARFAEKKAQLALKHRSTTRDLRDHETTLLVTGDILWAGGAYAHGIAVGVSGLPEHIDEAVAWMILSMIAAISRHNLREFRKNGEPDFVS